MKLERFQARPEVVGEYTPSTEWHFLQRLHERYDIQLTRTEVRALREHILAGKAQFRAKDGILGRNSYYVQIKGKRVPIIAHGATGELVTALPPESRNMTPISMSRQTSTPDQKAADYRDRRAKYLRRAKTNGDAARRPSRRPKGEAPPAIRARDYDPDADDDSI